MWANNKNSPGYQEWLVYHVCQANHSGYSGSVEPTGIANMFKHSITKNTLRYTSYIGDGDSLAFFNTVKESKPDGDTIITKLQCVGHIHKRLCTRCRELRVTWKGKKLSDGKGIMDVVRLTEKAINTSQNYYGMAIKNVG